MSKKQAIHTALAPEAIGPYSQAVKAGNTVYLSGQIPLNPNTMEIESEDVAEQAKQVFSNLSEVAKAAGGSLADSVKINISLTDLADFAAVNEVMKLYFEQPYPARACVQVAALPRQAKVEIEAILVIG